MEGGMGGLVAVQMGTGGRRSAADGKGNRAAEEW